MAGRAESVMTEKPGPPPSVLCATRQAAFIAKAKKRAGMEVFNGKKIKAA
jgi:hypothetical protein